MKTKDKFLIKSAELFGVQGFSGTGLKQIVTESDAAWGSVYHFFPGGKNQLGAETVELAGRRDNELFKATFQKTRNTREGIALIFESERKRLRDSDFSYGCTVASVASDVAATSDEVRQACSKAFELWQMTIAEALMHDGVGSQRADVLSSAILSVLEGATLLCRTHKSDKPMTDALEMVLTLIDDSIPAR